MVETPFPAALGMATEAGCVVVRISAYFTVFPVHVGLQVAVGTCELGIIGWIGVAVRTCIPGPVMAAGIDRKVLLVVVCKICRTPARGQGVAEVAGGWETQVRMVWVRGGIVVVNMACYAFRRETGIGP